MKRLVALAFLFLSPARADTVSPLLARGHVVMPQPQVVRLGAGGIRICAGLECGA